MSAVLGALAHLATPLAHYEVRSTFDSWLALGNLGRVMDLARKVFGTSLMPIVAGTPSVARHCAFGNLFAGSGTDGKTCCLDRLRS